VGDAMHDCGIVAALEGLELVAGELGGAVEVTL
jgi:hypothetical protein